MELKSSAEVASTDALSRLPFQYKKGASVEEEIFLVASQQLNRHPVSMTEMSKETSRNPTLATVLSLTLDGWPLHFSAGPQLKPYFTRKNEFSVKQGCLM